MSIINFVSTFLNIVILIIYTKKIVYIYLSKEYAINIK